MWVIFRDPKDHYTYLDKNVLGLVEDKDILEFQKKLAQQVNQIPHMLVVESKYLQPLVGNHYYTRHYETMTLCTDIPVPQGRKKPETLKASLFRDAEPQSPCST